MSLHFLGREVIEKENREESLLWTLLEGLFLGCVLPEWTERMSFG